MKRFTETTKWEDPWFRRLKPKFKVLFLYLVDRCDNAGVWVVDLDLAMTFIGERIDPDAALNAFEGRVEDLQNGKWLVTRFIPFQFGELSPECKPHQQVMSLVERHGLVKNGKGYQKGKEMVSEDYQKGINTLQDKDKDKDKDKEEDKGKKGCKGGEGQGDFKLLASIEPELTPKELALEVFAAYPRKDGKAVALAAILKAFKLIAPLELRDKVQVFASAVANWKLSEKQYVPHCATWMNQKRWEDDPSAWKRGKGPDYSKGF